MLKEGNRVKYIGNTNMIKEYFKNNKQPYIKSKIDTFPIKFRIYGIGNKSNDEVIFTVGGYLKKVESKVKRL